MTIYAIMYLPTGEFYRRHCDPSVSTTFAEETWVEGFDDAIIFSDAKLTALELRRLLKNPNDLPFSVDGKNPDPDDFVVASVAGDFDAFVREILREERLDNRADALVRSLNEYGEGIRDLYERR